MSTKTLLTIATIFVLVNLVYGTFAIVGFGDNSVGTRVGVPVKFSYKGWFFQTYEGELSISGLQEGGVPYIWKFSLCDSETRSNVIKVIQENLGNGKQLKVSYESPFVYGKWTMKSGYCVTDIKVQGE